MDDGDTCWDFYIRGLMRCDLDFCGWDCCHFYGVVVTFKNVVKNDELLCEQQYLVLTTFQPPLLTLSAPSLP